MDIDINAFESLGGNCEFGFLQRHLGNETSGAFRWTEITQPQALINVLEADLQGMFNLEDLRPFNAGMVLDTKTGIGWHSHIRSRLINPEAPPIPANFEFVTIEKERRSLHSDQYIKIEYMCQKTRDNIQRNNKIFVYKPLKANYDFRIDHANAIYNTLNKKGAYKFLLVTSSNLDREPGSVIRTEHGFLHGAIDRFAPGNNAKDISLDCWIQICLNALLLA